MKILLKIAMVGMISVLTMELSPSRSPSLFHSFTKPGCNIKGNISYNTGKKIYHLPGMEDYKSTVIDGNKGEKWFCKESNAISNGWSKAPR